MNEEQKTNVAVPTEPIPQVSSKKLLSQGAEAVLLPFPSEILCVEGGNREFTLRSSWGLKWSSKSDFRRNTGTQSLTRDSQSWESMQYFPTQHWAPNLSGLPKAQLTWGIGIQKHGQSKKGRNSRSISFESFHPRKKNLHGVHWHWKNHEKLFKGLEHWCRQETGENPRSGEAHRQFTRQQHHPWGPHDFESPHHHKQSRNNRNFATCIKETLILGLLC